MVFTVYAFNSTSTFVPFAIVVAQNMVGRTCIRRLFEMTKMAKMAKAKKRSAQRGQKLQKRENSELQKSHTHQTFDGK